MKKYNVLVNIYGNVIVEADNPNEAIEKAKALGFDSVDLDLDINYIEAEEA